MNFFTEYWIVGAFGEGFLKISCWYEIQLSEVEWFLKSVGFLMKKKNHQIPAESVNPESLLE